MEDWKEQSHEELMRIAQEQKARIGALEDALDLLSVGPNCWCHQGLRPPMEEHTDDCNTIRRARLSGLSTVAGTQVAPPTDQPRS